MTRQRAYHHGDLRRTLLAAAVDALGEQGPAALSLRDLARRAGVSHAAPAHHFGDKAGLLTALAAEGYDLLAAALTEARTRTGSFLEVGVAYVVFAAEHRAHFEVMFRPDLYRPDDPQVVTARGRARDALYGGAADVSAEARSAGLAAWSIVHGFATLWLSGALPPDLGDDPAAVARPVIGRLRPGG